MKIRILNFFKYDRSYNGAMNLYLEIGRRSALKQKFHVFPESEIKWVLFEELRQMAEISQPEFGLIMKRPVIRSSNFPLVLQGSDLRDETTNKAVSVNPVGNNPIEVRKINFSLTPSFKVEDEFPFLKKQDCPSELNKLIFDFFSDSVGSDCTIGIENNEDDPQGSETFPGTSKSPLEVVEELNLFKTTLQEPGSDVIVTFSNRIQTLQSSTVLYLYKLKKRLIDNISQNKKNLKKDPTHPNTPDRIDRDLEMKKELTFVNLLLNS